MQFIPYSCQQIDDSDIEAVCRVLRSEYLTQGPAVPEFEESFARKHAAAHAVAVSNATAGLHIACHALGVGPGSLVWTSPNSFVASANCALYCGADVGFVDIDPQTRNMSVTDLAARLSRAKAEGRLPQVVIPVDFAGLPCDRAELRELANQYGFKLLFDSSHAVGATYRGEPVGSNHADVSVFSFHPVKVMTTAEGGMVTTKDAELASRLRLLRSHGITREASQMSAPPEGAWCYEQQSLGFNYRLTDIQAALGTSQLARVDAMRVRRDALARRYDELLAALPVFRPARQADRESAHHLYVVQLDAERCPAKRRDVFTRLRTAGIGANVHYIPIHLQPYYRQRGFGPGDFPHAERYYEGALTLPLYPALTYEQQDYVVNALKNALGA